MNRPSGGGFAGFLLLGSAVGVLGMNSSCSSVATTILLVRHAEKESGEDPPLTEAGRLRAEALVGVARHAGVTAVYATGYLRTRRTAEPLARHLALDLTVVDVGEDVRGHARSVARDILTEHGGETVLVVGHSDTVPLIMEELGVREVPSIAETEYDRLFVVFVVRRGEYAPASRFIEAKYGH